MEKLFLKNGITVEEKEVSDLDSFCDFLLEKNKAFNLTAIREPAEVYEKHFLDSLMGREKFESGKKILEVGSGGGFPSVPLKIFNRDLNFTLLEATGKKCAFLNEVKQRFNFSDFTVVNARAEEYVKTCRESFDAVTARAVASLNVLCELCLPYLKVGGSAIFYKQQSDEEINQAQSAIKLLGGKIKDVYQYSLPSLPENKRVIITIEKIKPTPEKYPREYKKILKTPL